MREHVSKMSDAHQVSIKRNFWMMTSEVTQKLYLTCCLSTQVRTKGKNPVEKVSWRDAVLLPIVSVKRKAESDVELIHNRVVWSNRDCSGWRLPTEEWEYAARARSPSSFAGGIIYRKWHGLRAIHSVKPNRCVERIALDVI